MFLATLMLPCICCLCKQVVLWSNIYCVSVVLTGCFCSLPIADEIGGTSFMIQTHLFGGAAVHEHSAMMHRLNNVPPQQTPQRDQNNIFVIPHVGNFIKWQKKPHQAVWKMLELLDHFPQMLWSAMHYQPHYHQSATIFWLQMMMTAVT